jgi:hypothetical protein
LRTERDISVSRSQPGEKKSREVLVSHMHEPKVNDELMNNVNHTHITCKQYIREKRDCPDGAHFRPILEAHEYVAILLQRYLT